MLIIAPTTENRNFWAAAYPIDLKTWGHGRCKESAIQDLEMKTNDKKAKGVQHSKRTT